jgi:hypothetical protein
LLDQFNYGRQACMHARYKELGMKAEMHCYARTLLQ